MGNPYNLAIKRYQNPQFKAALKADPAGQLAKMMGIQYLTPDIRKAGYDAIVAMCGVILYRHLDRYQQGDVMQRISDIIDNGYRELGGKLRGIVAIDIFQPQWNIWSLSGKEVIQMAKSNKNLMEVLDRLSLHAELKLNVMNFAGAFYLTAKLGPKGALAEMSGVKMVKEIGATVFKSTGAKALGWIYAIAFGIGTVMYEESQVDYDRAEKERLLRTGPIQ